MAASRPDCGLSRRQRITRSSAFRETYDQGCNYVGKLLVLWVRKGPDAALKLGVVASKKVGNAVARARAKRLLRAAFRLNRARFDASCDLVLVARYRITRVKSQDVEAELVRLARRAGILTESSGDRT